MPKPNSKKQRALDCVARAQAEVGKALSLLGGRTRHKPKYMTRQFTARQYLESISQRLYVVQDLVVLGNQLGEEFAITEELLRVEAAFEDSPSFRAEPRDSFEREYDAQRKPEC